eukprot:scaffold141818_cov112-Phaeocystis_antarctica.AAC.1
MRSVLPSSGGRSSAGAPLPTCTNATAHANTIATASLASSSVTGGRCFTRRDAKFMRAPQIAAPTGNAAVHAGQERVVGGASPRKEGLFTRAAPAPSRSICTGQARGMASPRKR